MSTENNQVKTLCSVIPIKVFKHPKLTWREKCLFGIINYMDKGDGIYILNKDISNLINTTPQTVSNGLSKLKKYKYIKMEYIKQQNDSLIRIIYNNI